MDAATSHFEAVNVEDLLSADIINETPWSHSFGDAAFTLVAPESVIDDLEEDEVTQELRDLVTSGTLIYFRG